MYCRDRTCTRRTRPSGSVPDWRNIEVSHNGWMDATGLGPAPATTGHYRSGARHYRPLVEDKPFAAAEHAVNEVLHLDVGEITFHR